MLEECVLADSIQSWKHVFKLDPDKELDDEALDAVCMSGTDAIMVGGSSGVTYENTVDLLSRVRRYEVPCVLEVSDLEAVVPGFDLYMIPMVLNTTDSNWILGQHQRAIEQLGYMIPWDLLVAEGYIVLNGDSTVAKLTGADTSLDASSAASYAQIADKLMHLPIVYVEYSGAFGDMELVQKIHRSTERSRVLYGGGIVDKSTALQAAAVCDTIVVGNIIYRDLAKALETIAVKLEV
ncbi:MULTISPECIES: heptaprenylglyceryl phosphate synthase [Paenibacillus]|uniref:heptaprenylglyceryl phosphate synthase n=1 Tax=Paenibacillus TaxID=44249 RepID=UPI000CDA7700|nr:MULTISPECIES: heptaprenylglyceryl phosphate synthase [Paenibacillus]POR26740.1 geranylgeranylglyceryl/heptaprenylglyceryl phosphate synthase [Paenibacillus polymyxa]